MPKRSPTWNFFEVKDEKVICKICHCQVRTSGNTSNMLHHIEKHHPDVYLTHFKSSQTQQMRIDTSIKKIISTQGGETKTFIDQTLLWWIIDDSRPFSICETVGFKRLMKALNSNYTPPGRKAITERMNKLYNNKKELVITHLKHIKSFTLTSDLWSDTLNTKSYIGLTIHYIDDYVSMKLCLSAKEFPFNHTAAAIAESINGTLAEFEIDGDKIFATVTDAAANMVAAMREVSPKHIECVAHKINLLVTESISGDGQLVNMIAKMRLIVTFFKQSNKAQLLFMEEQAKDVDDLLKLKQDVQTRWNSTYLMIERFLKLRDYVSIALRKSSREEMDLDYQAIDIFNEIKSLLKPFYQMTLDVSGEKYVNISRVIPLVTMIRNLMDKIKPNTMMAKNLKNRLTANLDKRFGGIERNLLYAYSTILDPRFKQIDFTNPGCSSLAVSKLNSQLRQVTLTQPVVQQQPTDDNVLWGLHINRVSQISHPDISLDSSLKHYLELPNIDLAEDPLIFWNKYKDNFHHLHNMALLYLNIPASSVPCERLFSKTGAIVNEKRNRIKPAHVNNLCFLESLPTMFR